MWTAQIGLGAFVGFSAADYAVTTRVWILDQAGRCAQVRVEVCVLGYRIDEESGQVNLEFHDPREERRFTISMR